jgi:hypothetical protein
MLGELAGQITKNTADLFDRSNLVTSSLEGMPTRNVPGMQMAAQSLPAQPQPTPQVAYSFQPSDPRLKNRSPGARFG